MRSKLFVATLLLAAVGMAGEAVAQTSGPGVINSQLKKDNVKCFNVTVSGGNVYNLELLTKSANADPDMANFDANDTDDREVEDATSVSNGVGKAYEAITISAPNGTQVVTCAWLASGPNTKFTLLADMKVPATLGIGDVARQSGGSITEATEFELYGPVAPEFAGIQRAIQELREGKRR